MFLITWPWGIHAFHFKSPQALVFLAVLPLLAVVNKQPTGVLVGIVSFSDFGALVQPPTKDKKAATKAIDRLQPERGTNIGGGLEVALDSIYEALDLAPPVLSGSQSGNQSPG